MKKLFNLKKVLIFTLFLILFTLIIPNKVFGFQLLVNISENDKMPLTLEVEPSDTIEDVKVKIEDKMGIKTANQELIYNGQILSDKWTLAEYTIPKEAEFDFIYILDEIEVRMDYLKDGSSASSITKANVKSTLPAEAYTDEIQITGWGLKTDEIDEGGNTVYTPMVQADTFKSGEKYKPVFQTWKKDGITYGIGPLTYCTVNNLNYWEYIWLEMSPAALYVGGENIYTTNGSKSNSAGTATFDYDTYTLTLNSYNGGSIECSSLTGNLKIAVNGTNVIDGNVGGNNTFPVINCFYTDKLSLEIFSTSNGSLTIKNGNSGITSSGDVNIHDVNITIDKIDSFGIQSLYGNITTNAELNITIGQDFGIFAEKDVTVNGGTIEISKKESAPGGEIIIAIPNGTGIFAGESIIINNGNIDINVPQYALNANNEIIINAGNLNFTSTETTIESDNLVIINGGTIYIKSESMQAIYVEAEDGEAALEIADYMKIVEEGLDVRAYGDGNIKSIGKEPSAEALTDEDIFLDEMAKEVTIDYINKEHSYLDNTEKVEGTAGELSSISFRIDAKKENFKWIKIGGILLNKDDYTLKDGSTIITLTEKGLNKINGLAAGTYDVEIKFASAENTCKGTLVLAAAELPEKEENNNEDVSDPQEEKNNPTNDEKNTTNEENNKENPKTGDTIIYSLGLLFISSLGIIILYNNKK